MQIRSAVCLTDHLHTSDQHAHVDIKESRILQTFKYSIKSEVGFDLHEDLHKALLKRLMIEAHCSS